MSRRCALSFMVLLSAVVVPARAQVTLGWKFKQGATFTIDTVSHYKQTLVAWEREIKQDIEQRTVLRFTVKQATGEQVVLEERIESLTIKDAGASATAEPKAMEQVQGAVFAVTLGPGNKIVNFDGYDRLIKRLAGDDPKVRQTIQAAFPEEAIKNSAGAALDFLPDRPVSKGDTWQRETKDALGPLGSLSRINHYSYEGTETVDGRSLEKVGLTARVTYTPPDDKAFPGSFVVKSGKLEAENVKGTLFFDAAAGRLVRSELQMTLKGELSLDASGTTLAYQVRQQLTVTTRVLDNNPAEK